MKRAQEQHWRDKAAWNQAHGATPEQVAQYVRNADALCDDPARLGTLGVVKSSRRVVVRPTTEDHQALKDRIDKLEAKDGTRNP